MASPDEHNRELQRQIEKRLQEIESSMNNAEAPFHKTVKHQPESSQKPWMKKAILGAKLFGLGVAVLVAVQIAAKIAAFIIFAALAFLAYKIFLESRINQR